MRLLRSLSRLIRRVLDGPEPAWARVVRAKAGL